MIFLLPRDDDYGWDSGALYVFARDDKGTPDLLDDRFVEVEKLLAVDAQRSVFFGSPRFVGDELFAGSNHDGAGAIYLYDFGHPCPGYLGMRNGNGANTVCAHASGPAVVGSAWEPWLETGHHAGAALSFLEGRTRPLVPSLSSRYGEVLIDVFSSPTIFRAIVPADVGGTDEFSFPIPNDPALVGRQFFVQGGILGGPRGAELCNALDVVIG